MTKLSDLKQYFQDLIQEYPNLETMITFIEQVEEDSEKLKLYPNVSLAMLMFSKFENYDASTEHPGLTVEIPENGRVLLTYNENWEVGNATHSRNESVNCSICKAGSAFINLASRLKS